MSEPIFEPNEEPLDENRIVEGLDDPDLPDPADEDPAPPEPQDPEAGSTPA